MTTSDRIRALASDGLTTTEIADRLGIRYQHAYNVLRNSGLLTPREMRTASVGHTQIRTPITAKPILTVDDLITGGFELTARWTLDVRGEISPDRAIRPEEGVYAFTVDGIANYVGVATTGLAKRFYFYVRPGAGQSTNQRLNEAIKSLLAASKTVEIFTASPPDFVWNGLPVLGAAGLECGLLSRFSLPWNKLGTS